MAILSMILRRWWRLGSLVLIAGAMAVFAPLPARAQPPLQAQGDSSSITVAGTVFQDNDHDGQQSPNEAGLAGVTVTLIRDLDGDSVRDADEPVAASAISDAQGNFVISDLATGPHLLIETDPAGYTSTTPNELPLLLDSTEASGLPLYEFGDVPAVPTAVTLAGFTAASASGFGDLLAGLAGLVCGLGVVACRVVRYSRTGGCIE
jgi:hypothetical protein